MEVCSNAALDTNVWLESEKKETEASTSKITLLNNVIQVT